MVASAHPVGQQSPWISKLPPGPFSPLMATLSYNMVKSKIKGNMKPSKAQYLFLLPSLQLDRHFQFS